jgi:hypothetical protein
MKKWANELNTTFSKTEVQMAKKHMKTCSTSLAVTEMQIKTMLRFHLTPLEWLPSRRQTTNVGQDVGKKCWWECKLVQPRWKTVWMLLEKLKIELLFDPAIPLLGLYLKECKVRLQQRHLHTHVYRRTIHNSQVMETAQMPHC